MNILKKVFEVIKIIVLICLAVIIGIPVGAFMLALLLIYFIFIIIVFGLFFVAQVITDAFDDDFL